MLCYLHSFYLCSVFLTASENDIYCSVAKLMSEYTVGKMPRAFVRITNAHLDRFSLSSFKWVALLKSIY